MSKLYLVPTPIGNLEDITLRALKVLREVDAILAEDTRVTGKLLKHYEIEKKLIPHHQFNEHKTLENIISKIKMGETIAMVTDAGTPGISDPGFLLVRECIKNSIEVECLPGPVAFIPALVNSGLPGDRFLFEGFLPVKKGRQTRLKILSKMPFTVILYESPHRLLKTLDQLSEHFGTDRKVCVSRELTKIFEENVRGTISEVSQYFSAKTIRGEIVIIIEGYDKEKEDSED